MLNSIFLVVFSLQHFECIILLPSGKASAEKLAVNRIEAPLYMTNYFQDSFSLIFISLITVCLNAVSLDLSFLQFVELELVCLYLSSNLPSFYSLPLNKFSARFCLFCNMCISLLDGVLKSLRLSSLFFIFFLSPTW